MNIQGVPILLLWLSASAALVAVALARCSLLGVPVWAIVMKAPAEPQLTVWPRPVLGCVSPHTRRAAKEVLVLWARARAEYLSALIAWTFSRCALPHWMPLTDHSGRGALAMPRPPKGRACRATKMRVLLAPPLFTHRVWSVHLAACITWAFYRYTPPRWAAFAALVKAMPFALTRTAAKPMHKACELRRLNDELFPANLARYGDTVIFPSRIVRARIDTGSLLPSRLTFAATEDASAPPACIHVAREAEDRLTAHLARVLLTHDKASLTRGADIEGRGRLVSVASRSGRLMRPSLSPNSSIHYTTNGITAPQTALYAYNNPEARRHGNRDRADVLKATAWRLCDGCRHWLTTGEFN